ncbi:MAG: hypothetical protein Q9174_007025, partial [Haloplaca sp. 1 TL-2023]
ELQAKAEFKSATHRIAAWRKPSPQRSLSSHQLFETGYDDDGEKYGGRNLVNVLNELNVEGAIVVARWYGGTLLGPVRFDHIKNAARDAILQFTNVTQSSQSVKKAKLEEDQEATRRDELIRILPERDQSIKVLRGLLAEKQSSSSQGATSPAKVPDYATLPLRALENLERARDATIGWVLKQIEKAEAYEAKAEAAEEKAVVSKGDASSKSQRDSSQPSSPVPAERRIAAEADTTSQSPGG